MFSLMVERITTSVLRWLEKSEFKYCKLVNQAKAMGWKGHITGTRPAYNLQDVFY